MIGLSTESPSRGTVEAELSRQIVASERLCAGALAIVMGSLMLALILSTYSARADGIIMAGMHWNILVFAGGIGYEVLAFFVLKSFAMRDRSLPGAGRFLNAFIETSLPTLLLFNIAASTGPTVALSSAAAYVYFLFIILSTLRLNPLLCVFTGSVAALEYAALTAWHWDIIQSTGGRDPDIAWLVFGMRTVTFFVGGLTAGFVSKQIRKRLFETLRAVEDRSEVVEMFGKHVSPEVVETLLAQGVGDIVETREVCVMVLDIRGFTAFSEHRPPSEVAAYLNALWTLCVAIVNQRQGIVNKFLGDGFMAVFGAPLVVNEYRENAVAAAREIIEEIKQRVAAGDIPPTRFAIGLHAGPALVGSVGSEERKEYTVIGDVVNVAFRIEELNKRFDSVLLASDTVHPFSGEAEAPRLESLQVKGRSQPVQVFRLA